MNQFIVGPYTIDHHANLTFCNAAFESEALIRLFENETDAQAYRDELVNNFKEFDPGGHLAVPIIKVPAGIDPNIMAKEAVH